MSRIRCQMPGAKCQLSAVRYLVYLDVPRCTSVLVSDFKCRVSGARCQLSVARGQGSAVSCQGPGVSCQLSAGVQVMFMKGLELSQISGCPVLWDTLNNK